MARRRKKNPYAGIGSTLGGVGSSAASAGGKKGSRKKQNYANVGSALGGVGSSSSHLGSGLKHAAKREHKQASNSAIRAVTKYAAGEKSYKPTLSQIRTAWPKLTPDVQDVLGPAILKRAASEVSPEFGVKGKNKARPLPTFLRKYNPEAFDTYNKAIPGSQAVKESQAATDKAFDNDLGRAVEAGLLVAPVGGVIRAGKLGVDAVRGARAAKAAKATESGTTTAKVAETVAEGTVRQGSRAAKTTRLGRGVNAVKATKTGQRAAQAGRAAKTSAPARAAVAASKTKTGRFALNRAKQPIRTTAAASVLAQAPIAAKTDGDIGDKLGALAKPITEGTGVVPDLVKGASDAADNLGVVGHAVSDVFELPVAAVPSLYLLGKAGVEAIGGDSTELKKQWESYKDQGFLPAALSGDFDEALERFKEHPVYSALEVSGAESVIGRGAGMATRAASGGKLANRDRAPLALAGGDSAPRPIERTRYSPDLLKSTIQKRRDARRATDENGRLMATPREEARALGRERVDRAMSGHEGARKTNRGEKLDSTIDAAPKRTKVDMSDRRELVPPKKMNDATLNAAGSKYVNLGISGNALSFINDLRATAAEWEAAAKQIKREIDDPATPEGRRASLESQLAANEYNRAVVQELIKRGDPEAIFATARANAKTLNEKIDPERTRQGLPADQAERARLTNAAVMKLEAKQGKPVEQVKAYEDWRSAGKAPKQANKAVGRAKARKATVDKHHARSQARLELFESQANRYRKRLDQQEAQIRREIADRGFTVERARRLQLVEQARYQLDRIGKTRLNRERARLTELEGKRIEAEAAINAARQALADAKVAAKNRGKKPQVTEQLVGADGRKLTNEDIVSQLQAQKHDTDLIAHVSLKPHQSMRGAMFTPGNARPQASSGPRLTGEAVRRGTFDPSYETMVSDIVGKQGKIDATNAWDSHLREFQYVPRDKNGNEIVLEDGKMVQDARANPENFGLPPGDYVAVRRYPFLTRKHEAETAEDLQTRDFRNTEDFVEAHHALDDALGDGTPKGDGPFTLLRRDTAERMREHYNSAGKLMKALQMVNQTFKQTVLTISPKWIPGNFISANMRTLMAGHIPPGLTFNVGGRRLRDVASRVHDRAEEMDPYGAARAEAELGHGLGITSVNEQIVHRSLSDLSPTNPLVRIGVRVGDTKFGQTLHRGWKGWTQAVFGANERFIENPVVKQNVGAALIKELSPTLQVKFKLGMKLSDEIIDNLADGYLDPANTIKLAKVVGDVTGQWTGNSPMARSILSGYAPFGMWTRAATKYVLVTLPAHHPIKTAILANIELMTLDERKDLGLSLFSDRPLPPGVLGGIPRPDGGILPVSGLSDFGYFDNYGSNVASAALPYVQGSLAALRGQDVFGNQLKNEDGTPMSLPNRWIHAGLSFMGSTVPGVGRGQTTINNLDEGVGNALLGQFPFTNASAYDPGLVDYLRDLDSSRQISVPVDGSSSSPSSSSSSSSSATGTTLEPWFNGSSSSSSSSTGTTLEPWFK